MKILFLKKSPSNTTVERVQELDNDRYAPYRNRKMSEYNRFRHRRGLLIGSMTSEPVGFSNPKKIVSHSVSFVLLVRTVEHISGMGGIKQRHLSTSLRMGPTRPRVSLIIALFNYGAMIKVLVEIRIILS